MIPTQYTCVQAIYHAGLVSVNTTSNTVSVTIMRIKITYQKVRLSEVEKIFKRTVLPAHDDRLSEGQIDREIDHGQWQKIEGLGAAE